MKTRDLFLHALFLGLCILLLAHFLAWFNAPCVRGPWGC